MTESQKRSSAPSGTSTILPLSPLFQPRTCRIKAPSSESLRLHRHRAYLIKNGKACRLIHYSTSAEQAAQGAGL